MNFKSISNKMCRGKFLIIGSLILYSGTMFSQEYPYQSYMDSLDRIIAQKERGYRLLLDQEDSIYLADWSQRISQGKESQQSRVSQLTGAINDTNTPMVLAEAISRQLIEIDGRITIHNILENINVVKFDAREASPWLQGQYPYLNVLLHSKRLIEAYDIILHTDFLDRYHIIKQPFDSNSIVFFTLLFRLYSPSKEMINYALLTQKRSEKYYKILNTVLVQIEK